MIKFLAIGPPKCGTTLLQNILIQHPQLFLSPKKEIQFFNYYYEKGYDWYNKHFEEAGNRISGEISPTYCDSIITLQRIRKYEIDTGTRLKIIFTVRDPLKRLMSEYYHNITRGNYAMVVDEALRIETEEQLPGKYYNIIRNSRYFEILQDVYNLFDKENVLIIDSDKQLFNRDKQRDAITVIEDFLEVAHYNGYNFDIEDNSSYVPKSYTVQKAVFHNQQLKNFFRFLIPSFTFRSKMRSLIKRANTKQSGYDKRHAIPPEKAVEIYNAYLKSDYEQFKIAYSGK